MSAGTKQSDVKVRGGTFDLGLHKSLSPPEIFPLKLTQFYICNSIRGVWLAGPGAEGSVVLNTLHYHPRPWVYILPKAVGGGVGKIRVFKGFLGRIRNFDNMLYLCVLCCGHVGPGKNKDFLVEYTPMGQRSIINMS